MLRKVKDTTVSLWVHDSEGNRTRLTYGALEKYLQQNGQVLQRLGFALMPVQSPSLPDPAEQLPNYEEK